LTNSTKRFIRHPKNQFTQEKSEQSMNSNLRPSSICLAIGLLSVVMLSNAQAEKGQFYVKADAGGAVTTDTELKEFFGEPLAPNTEISFDPGFHLGIRGGYGVTDWFDAELETGFTINRIDSATGATEADGDVTNVPLLVNARFHLPGLNAVSPYIGGGFGFSSTILWADDLIIGGTLMEGSVSGIVFAYQAFAGVRVAINERMGLSLEYHYFATTSSEMEVDVTVGTTSDEVRLGGVSSHLISLAFDYRF
jgi:opacity protein-like surface antigen